MENFQHCARGLYHLTEKWGDDLAKIGDFQGRKMSLVGFFDKHFPRCARSLYHLIEKWGGDLAKIVDFQRKMSLVCLFI